MPAELEIELTPQKKLSRQDVLQLVEQLTINTPGALVGDMLVSCRE